MGGKILMKFVVLLIIATMSWLGVSTSATTSSGKPPACLESISTSCDIADDGDTTAQLNQCFKALTNAINNDIACFCLLKDDTSAVDAITTLFTYCKIDGSIDSLCSTDTSTTPTSTSTSSTSTSTGSEASTFGKKNAGNKMATTSVSSLLVVVFMYLTIM